VCKDKDYELSCSGSIRLPLRHSLVLPVILFDMATVTVKEKKKSNNRISGLDQIYYSLSYWSLD